MSSQANTSSRCTSCPEAHPPDKQVLKDISLSFLPGAKIGVLGLNGAGKSTLLRIMAGIDNEFRGEAQLAPGATVGTARAGAAPRRDEGRARQRRGRRRRAARRCSTASTSLGASNYSDDDARTSSRSLQDQIDAADAWNLDAQLDHGDGRAARCPPARRRRHERSPAASAAASRSAACCSRSPTCCCSTSRRTTSTPSPSPGSSATSTSTRARSSRSPTIATSSTTSPAGSSSSTAARASRSRATTRAGSSRSRPGSRRRRSKESARQRTLARELEWVRQTPRAASAKSKARLAALRAAASPRSASARLDDVEIHIPPGPRLGDVVIEADGLRKAFGDRLLIEDLNVLAAARRHRRRDRPERRRQDDAVPHDRRRGDSPTTARSRSARPSTSRTSTSRATRSTRTRPSGRRSPAATTRSRSATAR